MDRNALSRILLIVSLFFLAKTAYDWKFGKPANTGVAQVVETYERVALPKESDPGTGCTLTTATFEASVSDVGGGLRAYKLLGTKYLEDGKSIDLAHATSVDLAGNAIPEFTPLRTYFRNGPAEDQVPGDLVVFSSKKVGDSCVLTHVTPGVVEITRTLKPTSRPYEIETETRIKNLASTSKKHAFSTATFALQAKGDEGGMLKRPSANAMHQAACKHDDANHKEVKLDRLDKGKLEHWVIDGGRVDFAALTTNYFGEAISPIDAAPTDAHCALIAQDRGVKGSDSEQVLFRAAIAYGAHDLLPNAEATYKQLAYFGPKERDLLATAGGGTRHLDQLIDLGMFSLIANVLVAYLAFLQSKIGSWGFAIVLMTVTVRLALAPLTLPQIKMSLAMRRLKPETDAINAKYADDAQAKMLATQALHKREGINPLSGCAPALIQMPVWLSLYTALQTAIELYHEKFLVWHDLSAPDPYFALPVILGLSMFLQQKVTPMQMDPAQQKMMTYFMPAMFFVFMLFLPAGLALYSLTNSVLGIAQTLAVEKYMKSKGLGTGTGIQVKPSEPAVADKSEKSDKAERAGPKSARELVRRRDDAKA